MECKMRINEIAPSSHFTWTVACVSWESKKNRALKLMKVLKISNSIHHGCYKTQSIDGRWRQLNKTLLLHNWIICFRFIIASLTRWVRQTFCFRFQFFNLTLIENFYFRKLQKSSLSHCRLTNYSRPTRLCFPTAQHTSEWRINNLNKLTELYSFFSFTVAPMEARN